MFKKNIVCRIFFLLVVLASFNSALADESDPPTQAIVGTACSDTETTYLWSTSTRTQWELKDLYAVPVGTEAPEDWSNSEQFKDRMLEVLPQNPDVEDYAQACSSIWQEFFNGNADAVAKLKRNIATTDRIVGCVSGLWSIVSQNNSSTPDDSPWLKVGSDSFDTTNSSSTELLNQALSDLINNLNTQPGANTNQVESFVKRD